MKGTYYFSHDFNPTNDPKIICLLGNHGGLGYGVYWRIIELLHEEEIHKIKIKDYIVEAIAKQMQANAKQIEAIISDCIKFELFDSDSIFIWSKRVNSNIEKAQNISIKRAESGRIGGKSKQMLSKTKQNEAKENKIKENKINNYIDSKAKASQPLEINVSIKEKLISKGFPESLVELEFKKFISYWTEPNQNGKQRWQAQKFFDINRRIATWFSHVAENNNNFNNISKITQL